MKNKPPRKITNGGDDKPAEKEKPPEFEQETPHDPQQPEKAFTDNMIPGQNPAATRYSEDCGKSL